MVCCGDRVSPCNTASDTIEHESDRWTLFRLDCQVSWALSYFDLPSGSEPIDSGCKGPGRVAEAAHSHDQWSIHCNRAKYIVMARMKIIPCSILSPEPFSSCFSSPVLRRLWSSGPECIFPGSSRKLACSSCACGCHSPTAPLTRLCCIGCVGTTVLLRIMPASSPATFRSSCDTGSSANIHTKSDQTNCREQKSYLLVAHCSALLKLNSSNPTLRFLAPPQAVSVSR